MNKENSIRINKLQCRTKIGVPDAERKSPQIVEFDLVIHLDLAEAVATDDCDKTVDYQILVEEVEELAGSRTWKLLETLADAVARACLERPQINSVDVVARKFPLALRDRVESVEVRIRRKKS